MNFNKIKKYIWFLAIASLFNACDDSNELILNEPNHRVVYTSEMDFQNKIQVNTDITFGDASSGVQSRTWTFPDADVEIVGANNNSTSTKETVKAIFNKVGQHDVKLHQVFKGNAYSGINLMGKELDTTIVVTVLGEVITNIQANLVNNDGSLGDALIMAENQENEVTASKTVRYTYSVDGEPETFDWTFDGGDPATSNSSEQEIDIKYKRMGSYDVRFIAARARPFGGDTIEYKNLIKVIASTDPVDLEKITEKDGLISLIYSREMDATTLNKEQFSVTIENDGNIITPSILRASVDSEEANIVLLELDGESIYNDDVVKVSYTPGSLLTLDAVAADAFTDKTLEFTKTNILDGQSDYDASFENSTDANWPYMWWGGIYEKYTLQITDEKAHDGSKSAYIEMEPNGGMIIGHKNAAGDQITFPVEAGKDYEIGIWVYVEDLGANEPAGLTPDLRFFWFPNTNWNVGPNPLFSDDFKTGEWVYNSTFVQFSETGDKTFQIRGYNQENSKALKFYMDNISITEVKLRP
ncbi:hypothetical protein MHL31_06050 [Lutibacter sp. A80]|uniref:hypothetical protein n=1 Tax=Lutibacter sp. A80 TaxID=2918453 RepID=UPI001F06BE09|nr:hypothetical protein [Lutibacter sp. A80]UMB61763.1 hypothetical protein MHL31_06050 [Lutibacter sp. A80]